MEEYPGIECTCPKTKPESEFDLSRKIKACLAVVDAIQISKLIQNQSGKIYAAACSIPIKSSHKMASDKSIKLLTSSPSCSPSFPPKAKLHGLETRRLSIKYAQRCHSTMASYYKRILLYDDNQKNTNEPIRSIDFRRHVSRWRNYGL